MIKRLKKLTLNIKTKQKEESNFDSDGYIELSEAPVPKENNKIKVKYYVLENFEDTKAILNDLRMGYNICIIKIKPLRNKDISELKRVISKIKKVCEVIEGDLVGMDEDYLIATPSFVEVEKGRND